MFFEIDSKAFENITNERMNPDPKKVLYISAISENDPLAGYPEHYFSRQYGKHPDATFLMIEDFDDLIAKLKLLPQDASFDRIEIMGHGKPGKIKFGNSIIREKDLEKLLDANLNLAAANSDLRFTSCSLGANTPLINKGERFLEIFGRGLLRKGGRVLASTRNIVVFVQPLPIQIMRSGMGVSNFMNIWMTLPDIWRDYKQVRNSIIEIQLIPSHDNKCRQLMESQIKLIH